MNALMAGARGELLRLRRWPALKVMFGVYLLLDVTFVYLFPYMSYRNGSGGFVTEGTSREQLLAGMLPNAVPVSVVQGMPMWGGAIMLALGALAAGSGYGWGTWKTAFTQGPRRLTVTGGSFIALAAVVIALIIATFAIDLGLGLTLGSIEGKHIALPAAADAARALAAGFLILGMWTVAGFAVGTLARGPALAVGLGVVWVLALENLLRAAGTMLSWLRPVTDVLPGTVVGSIAAAAGARPVSRGGTPGVVANLHGGPAVALALAYLAALTLTTAVLVKRRDIA
jgi:ABC-type transport system involved in multi-copper enzyme maturation permease subunit